MHRYSHSGFCNRIRAVSQSWRNNVLELDGTDVSNLKSELNCAEDAWTISSNVKQQNAYDCELELALDFDVRFDRPLWLARSRVHPN